VESLANADLLEVRCNLCSLEDIVTIRIVIEKINKINLTIEFLIKFLFRRVFLENHLAGMHHVEYNLRELFAFLRFLFKVKMG